MNKVYDIHQVSEMLEIPSSTLRYYEQFGLLTDVSRDQRGHRLYNDTHLARLEGIKCFKDGGLPVVKIREFYQYDDHLDEHIDDIIALVLDHEEDLSRQIQKMQKQLLHIQQKIRFYRGIKKAVETGKAWPCFEDFA